MHVGSGELTFEWIEEFAEIPNRESAARGWAHHGITSTPRDTLVTFHPGESLVLELTTDGSLLNSWGLPVAEAHGITVHNDGHDVFLWFSDIGRKADPDRAYEVKSGLKGGHIVKTTLDGEVVTELFRPPAAEYGEGQFSPTEVAVYSSLDGGNDDVWVTDGYGQSLIHRYDKNGMYLATISGLEGQAGRFEEPHAIWIDHRKPDPELYVADRSHNRIQVYDLEGSWKRSFGDEFLVRPGAFADLGGYLVVAELDARVSILDESDQLVLHLGANPAAPEREGWPNELDVDGNQVRTGALEEGLFNAPHGLTTDTAGNIYVAEWLIGGRHIKLARI